MRLVLIERSGSLSLVTADLGLTFPVALIKSSDKFLQRWQLNWFADVCNLILEAVRKTPVVLAHKRLIVLASAVCVLVEVDRVAGGLGRILVA